ncbi:MAG: efflux RND transporter periplasmic adaptor subunit [Verrucomicrobiales bacterium]|nr:efflux RND transporter periplasmic adaptor subunit [Verrucomicrobiales bacterium]
MIRLLLFPLFLASAHLSAGELSSVKPHRGTIHRWISLPANFAPWQQVEIKARIAGYVDEISVDKGDEVTANQKLIQLSVPELEADLIGQRAPIAAAQIEVKRLHEARAKSPDLVLPQAVDDAEAKLAIAEATMQRTQALINLALLRAPFSGIITERHVDPGAFAAAGGAPLLLLTDAHTLRLQIPVVEMETRHLRIDLPVEATIDALDGKVVKGSLSRLTGSIDPATRTMLVEADIDNQEGTLRPGLFATARIAVEQHTDTLLLPVAALVVEKNNSFVFKHLQGKAIKTAVKTGFNDGIHVEVPDLKVDDVILLPDGSPLADQQDVNLK